MKKNNSMGSNLTYNVPIKHFLLIMRTALILLFAFVFCSMAETGHSQNAKVSINKRNATLKEVLNEIENQTDYLFIYSNEINTNQNVSLKAKQQSVANVLNSILRSKDVSYSMEGNHIILSAIDNSLSRKTSTLEASNIQQQKKRITGVVVDDKGEAIIGANIVEIGTTNGTITDIDGNFVLEVASNAKVHISYIGYVEQEVSASQSTSFNIILREDTQALDELVVIGYGSSRKEDLSMAVSTVKMDNIIKSRSSDLATVLQGRLPGVVVQQTGDPLKSASFSIRGRGSKGNDGDPNSGDGVLFVVDGVPNAPYMVEDIESVTILKDAASAAIYGASVGSSGVVLITTRRAQVGKQRIDINVSFGMDKVGKLPNMLTAEQYNNVWAKAIENAPGRTLPSAADPSIYPWGNVTRTDWLDEIFRKGYKKHYAASISGGNEKVQSIFSVSFDDKKGILLNTWSKSFQGRLNTDFKITDWFKISERVSFEISDGQGNVNTNHEGPIMAAVWYPRSASVYEMNEDGTYALDDKGNKYYGGTIPKWASASGTPLIYNPVADLEKMHRLYPENKIFSTTSIEIKPLSTLTIKSDFTADLVNSEEDVFYPVMKEIGLMRTENFREQFYNKSTHWLSESTASWSQMFGNHHISAMGGFTADFKKTQFRAIYTRNYNSEDENQLIWGEAGNWSDTRPQELIYEYAMASLFGRIGYSYDDRYFLVGSIRRDASSKLPISKNYDWFPSISGSWKISSEKLFKDSQLNNVIDLLKLRAGWGKVGNVELYPNNVSDVELLNYTYPIILGKNLNISKTGSYLSTIPNLNARWETTEQTSAGLDITLLNKSLDISVDWYNKETKDLIDYVPTPSHLGVKNSPMGNMGNVVNKGWEFSVSYNGSALNNDFQYNIWGMFSTNKGYVKEYGIRDTPVRHNNPNMNSNAVLFSDAGYPWYSFMVYKTNDIFRSEDQINKYIYKNPETGEAKLLMPNAKVGDLIYVDTNNDGVINDEDKFFAGSYAPKNTFSFGTTLEYKGFDLSIFLQGVTGNKIYNGLKQLAMNGRNDYGNMIVDVLDTWDFNPHDSKYPRLGIAEDPNGNYTRISDVFLEKGDYLRLKNVTLGYSPKTLKNNLLSSIRIYLSMDNLHTFTGYTGIDPEVGNYGIDRGVYPISRFFNLGVNINF